MKLPDIRLESRALRYGYANARVKGMKGLLLKPAFLDELTHVRTLDAMVELLQRTHYKDYLIQLSLRHRGSLLIELASGRHFSAMVRKVKSLAPKEDRHIIESLLRRWDLLNLKTLINGLRVGRKFEEMQPYIIPVGSLSQNDLEKVAKAQDLFAEIKKTDFGKELLSQPTVLFSRQMIDSFNDALRHTDSFLQLQTILDASLYIMIERALGSGSKDVQRLKRILKKEIDAKNVLIIFRLKKSQRANVRNYLIKGGSLSDATISTLLEARDISAVSGILQSRFKAVSLPENATVVDLEIALEKSTAAEKLAVFHRSILSIGVLFGFLLLKEEELNNLRKIAKAKEFAIPEEEVKQTLVVV